MNYDMIRKNAMTKSVIPEGYGRSVVGGREIITAPTVKAEDNPLAKAPSPVDMIDNSQPDELEVYLDDYDDHTAFQGLQESASLMEMGKIPVYDDGGADIIYERDISDPNSLYSHPETGVPLFPSVEAQNESKKEFDKLLNEALIKKRLGK